MVTSGKQIRSMGDISARYSSSDEDWLTFLRCWNGELQGRVQGKREFSTVAELLEKSRAKLSAPGSPLHKARLEALEGLDRQRGARLPKSYRDFLSITGGHWVASIHLDTTGFDTNLLPMERVGLFKEVDKQNWGGWHRAMGGEDPASHPVPADVYYRYDDKQDDFRWEYLDSLVKVGELSQGAALLLNPRDVTTDGEWEAWLLSTQVGALRYRSFAELMQIIAFQEILGVGGVHVSREKLNATCARHLKTAATLVP